MQNINSRKEPVSAHEYWRVALVIGVVVAVFSVLWLPERIVREWVGTAPIQYSGQ